MNYMNDYRLITYDYILNYIYWVIFIFKIKVWPTQQEMKYVHVAIHLDGKIRDWIISIQKRSFVYGLDSLSMPNSFM